MGKVKYWDGIDYVSGALSKPKVRNGHSCGSYLIGTHRTAATTNPDCTRLYLKGDDAYKRSTAPTANEVAARLRFTTVAAAVKDRKEDLTHVNADKQAFLAQRDEPGGKTTMKAYLWYICGQEYDAAHPNG